MNQAQFQAAARGRVRWLRAEDGGRRRLPPGPIYAATAVFISAEPDGAKGNRDSRPEDALSIVLKYPEGYASTERAGAVEMDFLARELAKGRLVEGSRFVVMEGARPVAEGEVTSVLI